jgi:glutathione S-transferase
VLTEGPAVIQYLADLKPEAKLAPPNGTIERYRLQEWLNFITSELHKSFGALFNPDVSADYKQFAKDLIASKFAYVDRHLAEHGPFLMGSQFTVADAYLFTVANWTHFLKIDLGQWPHLKAYVERVAARPKVHEALKAERLVRDRAAPASCGSRRQVADDRDVHDEDHEPARSRTACELDHLERRSDPVVMTTNHGPQASPR